MESPFEILQIEPGADDEQIERAYRRRVKETHPDHGGSAREFQSVRAAYEELTDESRRYDGPATVEPDADDADEEDDEDETAARVEYLNYEVIEDHEWSLEDDDLFEKASGAGLDPGDYGKFLVQPGETLLEAAENRGFAWPYACRGGACANCAVAVTEGELSTPVNHILPPETIDRGIRLSCVARPMSDELEVVYNVKHLPNLDELRLPPRPFEEAYPTD